MFRHLQRGVVPKLLPGCGVRAHKKSKYKQNLLDWIGGNKGYS